MTDTASTSRILTLVLTDLVESTALKIQLDDARAAITEGRRINPDLSLELMQGYFGVSRPEVDARRNAALRQTGLE